MLTSVTADDNTIQQNLTIESFIDFGHIVNGYNAYGEKNEKEISMLPLNRANVMAIQSVVLDNFDVKVGLAGLVWWPYGGPTTDASQRVMTIKPMVPVARGRWQFGDPQLSGGSIQIGTFAYKYNKDAKNLGEYLYRSGTYPGFIWSNDGWLLMNRAGQYSHGLLMSAAHFNGMFKHNLSLFMETNYFPIGDFSPGYDFSINSRWLEFGGGIVLNHYLANRPSKLKKKSDQNTYVYTQIEKKDSSGNVYFEDYYGQLHTTGKSMDDPSVTVLHQWTSKGIKLMARAALNLGHLLPESIGGPEDLRIFSEVAVLGWKDQPLFYDNRSERMPIMFGINVPTFRLLDVLSVQGEYYQSPYNDLDLFNVYAMPIWGTSVTDSVSKDDWKWSIYGKRKVNKLLSVYGQIASDHFRLTDGSYKTSSIPLTTSPKEWYYLLRIEFAIR